MAASFICRQIAIAAIFAGWALSNAAAQDLSFKREQAELILEEVADKVAKHYYDPKLDGVDWNAKLAETRKKIEVATSRNLAFADIAAMLDSLNDSHTFFIPPPRSFGLDYGWRIQTIGEQCFVTHVRPETDAAIKIHPGDEVLSINDYKPARTNIVRIDYILNALRPQSKVAMTVRSIAGEERHLEILPKMFPGELGHPSTGDWRMATERAYDRFRPRVIALDGDVLVAKIPLFQFGEDEWDKVLGDARKHKSVILDLRGNPGGSLDSLSLLVSRFFDHDVNMADAVSRDGTKPLHAKSDRHAFSGKLTVLVDSGTRSTAEMFARIVQLEKRGIIMGDRTLGMVMESERYFHHSVDTVFGVSVSVANLIMSDGRSLEHIGVIPDELALPTADDIANNKDSVLAHAAEVAGAKLSPKDAAELFPYEWPEPYQFVGH